ncbi:MAG: tRNA preQ1(34) S-adenosylmethionine ribosyltransferase-isomerase QueA [Nitrosomonas sp.]|nr:tRNA preQ1(34) S-adenosylmethionine ribosyltransferase-isomerase QueA [Nitrosomonas sp.]
MKTRDFDFYLPPELVAQFPATQRANSKMLYLEGSNDRLADAMFADLPSYLRAGDVVVFNDTQVIKARLFGKKSTGGKVEILVERVLDDHHALAVIRASHAPISGSKLLIAETIPVTVLKREQTFYTLLFEHEKSVNELLAQFGNLPLPPYISRPEETIDESRYQTIYAKNIGAVAAPTAGLHFDERILTELQEIGVVTTYVTLHVGAGTFQPVRTENIHDHKMHSETYDIPIDTVTKIQHAKKTGGRVLAVGTTSLRALEASAASNHGELQPGYGETNIFITPGYRFHVVERLLTNFHLPQSTLLMLVSAFGGIDNIRHAYQHAIKKRYQFFSYGDAMLIEKKI